MLRAIPNRLQFPTVALLFVLGSAALPVPICSLSESQPVLELRLGYNIVVGDVQAAAEIMKIKQQRVTFLGS
jgi:hypothetical protein